MASEDEISAPTRLVCGMLAGLIAQSMTYPIDVVRRRMQVGTPYRGILHAFTDIAKNEGVRKGLYKGLSMNWLKGPVSVSISFTVNDYLKGKMYKYYGKKS